MGSEVMDSIEKNPELLSEYENSFTSEERIRNSLQVDKDSFTLEIGYVDFDDCSVTEPIKNSRKDTCIGLKTSVSEMGILNPIHVMVTEGYAD